MTTTNLTIDDVFDFSPVDAGGTQSVQIGTDFDGNPIYGTKRDVFLAVFGPVIDQPEVQRLFQRILENRNGEKVKVVLTTAGRTGFEGGWLQFNTNEILFGLNRVPGSDDLFYQPNWNEVILHEIAHIAGVSIPGPKWRNRRVSKRESGDRGGGLHRISVLRRRYKKAADRNGCAFRWGRSVPRQRPWDI